MPVRDVPAEPGALEDRPPGGTMFAACYGRLVRHPWHDPEHDAYQLFHQRSLAMGWLDEASADQAGLPYGATGLWAMNDAGWDHPLAAPGAGLIAWFQVEVRAPAGDRPLPVQPFLRCAADTMARAGTPHLTAVQLLLPVQCLGGRPPRAPVSSLRTVHWFADLDPGARTAVEVGVDGGRDPVIPEVAERLAERLAELDQDVFAYRSHRAGGPDDRLPPPFHDAFWNGPPGNGVVLHGELAEWSCDAAGWLAEVIADTAARLGVRSPLLLTVARERRRGQADRGADAPRTGPAGPEPRNPPQNGDRADLTA